MNVQTFYEELDNIFALKRLDAAEEFIRRCIFESEETGNYSVTVAGCNELGGLYRVTSRYDEAFPLYEKALKYIREMGLEGDESCGTTILNYATTLNACGRTEEALERYKLAVSIFEKCKGELRFQSATVHNNISSIYQQKGEYDTAILHLKKALGILDQLSDSEIEKAITYCNLAGIYIEMNMADEAWKWADRAVRGFKEADGEDDVHYPHDP